MTAAESKPTGTSANPAAPTAPRPRRDLLLIAGFAALMILINVILVHTNKRPWTGLWDWQSFGTMVAAAVTVAIMSQLYKDNPLFKLAEHMFVGSALGYGLVNGWYNIWVTEIIGGFRGTSTSSQLLGKWSIILPGIFGLLMYTRLNKKYAWVSRVPFALMIGFGVGISIPTAIQTNLFAQIKPMTVQLVRPVVMDVGQQGGPTVAQLAAAVRWNDLIALIGVLSTLIYFFFSLEHKRTVGVISRVGVWFLMVAFGASFGYTVMGRLSLLIGRIDFLFREWIPLVR